VTKNAEESVGVMPAACCGDTGFCRQKAAAGTHPIAVHLEVRLMHAMLAHLWSSEESMADRDFEDTDPRRQVCHLLDPGVR